MVAPVTGPFTVSEQVKTTFGYYPSNWTGLNMIKKTRTWYRQKRPFSLPLYFRYSDQRVRSYTTNEPGYWYSTYDQTYYESSMDANAYNKAYARFKKDLGENASLSVSLAERKQAMDMIVKRSTQLLSFVNALRKMDFPGAAKILGIAQPPLQRPRYNKGRKLPWTYSVLDGSGGTLVERGRRFYLPPLSKGEVRRAKKRKANGIIPEDSHKALANNYLEYHFGWSPLIKDIGSAIDVLQGGVPPAFVKGRAVIKYTKTNITGDHKYVHNVVQAVTLRSLVRITNPDLWLANQMGFVNPAVVAWELVPYSFVVDWFVNVGEYLQSFTDFLGLELINPSRTVFTRDLVVYDYYHWYSSGPVVKHGTFEGIDVKRDPGAFSGPVLKVRPPWVVSPSRGFAAISLLIQKM